MAGLVPTATHPIDESYIESKPETEHKFTEFSIISGKEVEQTVKKSTTKRCVLDPIPTSLIKEHLEDFVPILADIINNSLQNGKFLEKLKNTTAWPLLKKANLSLEDKNYRPVS